MYLRVKTYDLQPKTKLSSECSRVTTCSRVRAQLCIYVFVRPMYMCTEYRAPKAREQRSVDLYA